MKKNIFKLIILIFVLVIAKEFFLIIYVNSKNNSMVKSYYTNNTSFNIRNEMLINIPKIRLETIVKKADKTFSNLDKSLVYYGDNNYQNTIIILGHSGTGYGTYFSRLVELDNNDNILLYIDNLKLKYVVTKKYSISEYDTYILNTKKNKSLILITCVKNNKNKRLIVELSLNDVQNLKK